MLTGADITSFVERHAYDQSPRSAKSMCWTLRAFTRYLLYRGYTTLDLAGAVPSIRTWQFAALPEVLSSEQVQQVLVSCDRRSSIGKRDYAVLILLARLGLRANEIATLTLDDIHWHSSCLIVAANVLLYHSFPKWALHWLIIWNMVDPIPTVAEFLSVCWPHTLGFHHLPPSQ